MSPPTARAVTRSVDGDSAEGDGAAVASAETACTAAERPLVAAGVGAGLPKEGVFSAHSVVDSFFGEFWLV